MRAIFRESCGGQPDLVREFQASQGYIVRQYLKIPNSPVGRTPESFTAGIPRKALPFSGTQFPHLYHGANIS